MQRGCLERWPRRSLHFKIRAVGGARIRGGEKKKKNFRQELQWGSVERKEMMTKWIMIDIFANGKKGNVFFFI